MKRLTWVFTRLFVGAIASTLAIAQAPSGNELAEVVVTATRRAENLQDIPISVSVLSADELGAAGALSTMSIAEKIPNMAFANTGPLPVFAIRGVQLLEIIALGNEPPVAMYFDDVYVGSLAGQTAQLFDLENVQVLRGPQGTLFGRNATGGLVQYQSRKPTSEVDGYGTVRFGSFGQRVVEAAVGGPVAERIRMRAAATLNQDDGVQKNFVTSVGGRFNKADVLAGRLLTEVDLAEAATATLTLRGSRTRNQSPLYGMYGRLNPANIAQTCTPTQILAAQCVNRDRFANTPNPRAGGTEQAELPTDIDAVGGSLAFNLELGIGEVTLVSALDRFERFYVEDTDATGAPRFLVTYNEEARQFTQEVRLAGERGRAKYVAGAYYYDDARETAFRLPQLIAQLVPLVGPRAGTAGLRNRADVDTDSWALFAQTDLDLTDRLSATLGVRYTQEDKSLFMSDNPENPQQPLLQIITRNVSDDNVTGTAGLSWRPREDLLVYGRVSTGYKSGAFNTRGGVYSTLNSRGFVPNVYVGPEEANSAELGLKTDFAEDRMRLNAAVFYTKYKNLQVTAVDRSIPDVLLSNLVNAGDANIKGAELEFTAAPTSALRLQLGIGVLDTEIISDTFINNIPLRGNELPKAPQWNVSGLIRYDLPLKLFGGTVGLQADFRAQDDEWTSPEANPEERQEGFEVVNFRGFWRSDSDRFELAAFVENAFDEEYWMFNFQSFDYTDALFAPPRWVGASFTVRF